MTRRNFLAVSGGASLFLISRTAAKVSPNVLFIAIDDMNDWANCMGGREGVHTPNIDALAKRGKNAHCAAPSCNPSRAAIMTGIRPSTSGVYSNGQDWRKNSYLFWLGLLFDSQPVHIQ